jgi:hypothetical protein
MRVDVEALLRLSHACAPSRCRVAATCCNSYEVLVDRKEQRRILGHLNDAARYAIELEEPGGFVDPFEPTEGGTCLATDEDGQCVLAYRNEKKHLLCSLHSAALGHGLHGFAIKPMACAIWPLYYVEGETPLLTVQEGVTEFPCNRFRRRDAKRLDRGIADILRQVWGSSFLDGVEAAVRRRKR